MQELGVNVTYALSCAALLAGYFVWGMYFRYRMSGKRILRDVLNYEVLYQGETLKCGRVHLGRGEVARFGCSEECGNRVSFRRALERLDDVEEEARVRLETVYDTWFLVKNTGDGQFRVAPSYTRKELLQGHKDLWYQSSREDAPQRLTGESMPLLRGCIVVDQPEKEGFSVLLYPGEQTEEKWGEQE